jgi:hypothetical protein
MEGRQAMMYAVRDELYEIVDCAKNDLRICRGEGVLASSDEYKAIEARFIASSQALATVIMAIIQEEATR